MSFESATRRFWPFYEEAKTPGTRQLGVGLGRNHYHGLGSAGTPFLVPEAGWDLLANGTAEEISEAHLGLSHVEHELFVRLACGVKVKRLQT